MNLQPKTRKYRVSFRNKTEKKCKLSQSFKQKSLNTNMYSNTLDSKVIKLKVNFTDSVSQISTSYKSYRDFSSVDNLQIVNYTKYNNGKFNVYSENTENNKNRILSHNLLENQASAHTCATLDKLSFGQRGIYFCNTGTITAKFIEMARLAVARKLKKSGRFWIRICPDTPVTVRSAETRMGRGKGGISHYSAKIRAGQVFMEFCGVSEENISKIYQELKKKAPLPIKLVH